MLAELWTSLWCHLYFLARPMIKWILRKVTGKCELLRITYGESAGAGRTKRIEKSLKQSHQPALKQILSDGSLDITEAVKEVLRLKSIVPEVHPNFQRCFSVCVCQICGYRRLLQQVEHHRKTKYSTTDKQHEDKLMLLWTSLMPTTKLESRVSKQWTDIGFQGEDPATDFRGMGLLGLDQLLYFIKEYPDIAQSLLSQSHHPQYGFSFAILGINFTGMCYDLLKSRKLRTHFYNLTEEAATMKQFNEIYCCLFHDFIQFWFKEKPRDIMEFGRLRDMFQKLLVRQLRDKHFVLRATFQSPGEEAS
ncbi:ELMO domain-containing protein 2-like [Haliotis rufescens]|uniref:ELMO domain-containing protein 2-like n=1 Tax=Haliotis rufescens TaxID=6454 RepID=UPI001EB03733|nr:ELMO domain-containing protein 2-like [Haliotis rufescens]XP_046344470.1 ELMO domain-containing protein 2-like [Haliotis rufescens]XP_046344471.1 ELMO domain-containing protein 2-like [Haliotis rufescens]